MSLKKIGIALSVIMLCLSAGCSQTEQDVVKDDLGKVLNKKLGGVFVVSDIEITAFENIGTKVEPKYRSRYVAKLNVSEAMYEKIGVISSDVNHDVVIPIAKEGSSINVFGVSTSVLEREKIVTEINSVDFNRKNIGDFLSEFSNPVVGGSSEHKAALEHAAKWNAESPARMKKFADRINGIWSGSYVCSGKSLGFNLNISVKKINGSNVLVGAIFEDIVKPGSGDGAESFSLNGYVSEKGSFAVEPGAWITHLYGGTMAGFLGNVNSDLNKITGKVVYGGAQCTSFKLSK
ncbi:MAG: hypothetical protein K2Y25_15935 [Pseudomonadaceae bacterium]|nr:hypothetical protein [Pseudomonadaceae bacterium]